VILYSNLKKIENLTSLEVYTCKLDLGDLKKKYIEIIDLEGDKQNKSTNIKADMTDWRLNIKYVEFKLLTDALSDIYKKILETYHVEFYQSIIKYHGDNYRFKNINIWGAKYSSKEKTVPHDHFPSRMSFCLYLKTPKGCPGLSFNDVSRTIPIEEDQLIIFDSVIRHSVKSKKFKGKRYVLAGDIL
jgi:hypothetical protein